MDVVVYITPPILMILFFNFHPLLVELSGSYDFVCGIVSDIAILPYVVPKLPDHCDMHAYLQRYGLRFFLQRDLLIVVDLAILMLPFLLAPYVALNYRTHKLIMIRHRERHAKSHEPPRTLTLGFFGVCLAMLSYNLLFSPGTFDRPDGVLIVGDLMLENGIGTFFHALLAVGIPVLFSILLTFAAATKK